MTHLRKMMLEELERRNYAQTTTRLYIQTIEDFAGYFKRPPDQLGPEHILSNAFTSAFKKLEPVPQFKATAKLCEFLAQLPA